jgi:DNA repair exonuclease SbcCD ATPase subunit
MLNNRTIRWAAIVALVAGGGLLAGQAMTQDTKPPTPPTPPAPAPTADPMAEWLKARGIQVSPEQIEQARKIIEDVRNGGQVDPEQVQKIVADISKQVQARVQARIKDALGATDAEWEALGPKVEKVQGLMLQGNNLGTGMGMGMGMGLARAGISGINLTGAEPGEAQKKLQALQEIMKNKDAAVDDVRAALKNYREAQAKSKSDLDKARAEVKELLTVRQEAVLVKMGILE